MSDIRLSAIYTIYNEEDYIKCSLGSIYDEVDEIVICLTTGNNGLVRAGSRTVRVS